MRPQNFSDLTFFNICRANFFSEIRGNRRNGRKRKNRRNKRDLRNLGSVEGESLRFFGGLGDFD